MREQPAAIAPNATMQRRSPAVQGRLTVRTFESYSYAIPAAASIMR